MTMTEIMDYLIAGAIVVLLTIAIVLLAVLIIGIIIDIFFPKKNKLTEGVVVGKEYEEEHDEERCHTRLILMGKTLMPITNTDMVHVPTKYFIKIKGDDGTKETHEVSKKKFMEAEIFKRIKLQ